MDEVVLKLNRVCEIDKILMFLLRIEKSMYKYLFWLKSSYGNVEYFCISKFFVKYDFSSIR